ncbi:hypothetical protein AAF712_005528 [Marasmius tenuissimus]|uniref:Uncharacterized protein n=1 Tax=Marasmius tenuissimus TaxID=585030 RepID=A0ABR3A418_9AGAR
MSLNPSEIGLGDNHNNGNAFEKYPFPILSCGGENPGGNSFGNPINFMQQPIAPSSGGTWLANLKLAVISHKHADGSPCFNVLEHAVQADSEEDMSFTAAYNKLVDHFTAPEVAKRVELEKKLAAVTEERDNLARDAQNRADDATQASRPLSGTKRKSEQDPASSHRRPPPPRASNTRTASPLPSPPSYSTLGSEPYPNHATALAIYQHSRFRPGLEESPDFEWNPTGFITASPYIQECARNQRLPDVLPFMGSSRGNQLPPATPHLAERLISQAHTTGKLHYLLRLRDSMGLAQVLTTLKTTLRTDSLELAASFEPLISANPHPEWSTFTRFHFVDSTVQPSDSIANWSDGNSSKVPSVRTPGSRSTDDQYALFVWLHYESRGHMGIILTNSGYISLDSIMAHRVLHKMAPKEHRETFRRESIRLVTWPGLYHQQLQVLGLEVNPAGTIKRCPAPLTTTLAGVVQHFADCGVTIAMVDLIAIPHPQQRNSFAQLYKFGRIRSLFYSIHSLRSERIYSVPDHIDRAEVLEYRRRQFLIGHWKKQPGADPDMKVPTIRIPTSPPQTVSVPVEQLHISNSGNTSPSSQSLPSANSGSDEPTTVEASTDVTPPSTSGATDASPQLVTDQDENMDKVDASNVDAAEKDELMDERLD